MVTSRSQGFHYHPYDEDNWRWDAFDFQVIFGSFYEDIAASRILLAADPEALAVFIGSQLDQKCLDRRKHTFHQSLKNRKIYSMIVEDRVTPQEWYQINECDHTIVSTEAQVSTGIVQEDNA